MVSSSMALEYAAFASEKALLDGLKERKETISKEDIEPLVGELCDMYRALKREEVNQRKVYMPGGEWQVHINERANIYDSWLNRDIDSTTHMLQNFWRSELGIVQQYASYISLNENAEARARFVDQMAYDYMVWSSLLGADPSELTIPRVGNPWGYIVDDVLIAPKALRYHVLATQIMQITSDVPRPVIAEIGAGYGGVAHYLLRGDQPLTYIDFDLPEVLMLSAYYLKRTLPHRNILLYDPSVQLNAETLVEYDVILMPTWMLPGLPSDCVDLFLNTFSLSEMPMSTISEYIQQIERCCKGYFLHNNMDRVGVVQSGYERVPSSLYPISEKLKLIYLRYDLFQRLHSGRDGDYREYLYQRVHA